MRFNNLFEILEFYAKTSPDAPALKYEERIWSFSELIKEVRSRSEKLLQSGKTCLAVLSDGSAECVMNIFAANHAKLQVVMLDDTLPEELLAQLLIYADADTLWTSDEELAEILKPTLINEPAGIAAKPADDSASNTDARLSASEKCPASTSAPITADRILFFTSGTTSRSKAVVLTGKSLCSSAWNGSQMLPLSPEDTLLCTLPLAHVFGFVCGLLWGLSCGACVALGRGARHYIDDHAFYRPTAVSLVPSLLGFLLKAKAFGPQLRNILIGAGDCPPQLLDAVKAAGIAVSFGYGLTETSSGVAISTGKSPDPYAMDICPDDTITIAADGEVLIHAPTCIMQGYYKDPASTAEVLKDGILCSGDLGFIDADGRLHITGRKKDMLVLADGNKIFLPEYEAELARLLKTEETATENEQAEFAVDLSAGRPVLIWTGRGTREEIIKKIQPAMEMLPRGQQITDIIFTEGPLPRTATGKLKRWEIRQKANLK